MEFIPPETILIRQGMGIGSTVLGAFLKKPPIGLNLICPKWWYTIQGLSTTYSSQSIWEWTFSSFPLSLFLTLFCASRNYFPDTLPAPKSLFQEPKVRHHILKYLKKHTVLSLELCTSHMLKLYGLNKYGWMENMPYIKIYFLSPLRLSDRTELCIHG